MDALQIKFDQQSAWSDSEEEQDCEHTSNSDSINSVRSAAVTEEQLNTLELARNEHNTIRQTRWAMKCFTDWLLQNDIQVHLATVEKAELNLILRQFYGSIRTAKGELYSISSYLGLRTGLNRYLKEPPLSRSLCLKNDPEFKPANNVFLGTIKTIRREGRDKTTHHPSISLADEKIIRESDACNPNHPRGLLNKVWFDIQLHFGRRGKEGNRALTKESFVIKTDENGTKCCTLSFNEETKKHKDVTVRDRKNYSGFMFAKPGDSMCPVSALEKYLTKMPQNAPAFYLHPKKTACAADAVWYNASPLGVNQLAAMLPRICREASTSRIYTNHCLRATAIQRLSDSGLRSKEIMPITGHRSSTVKEEPDDSDDEEPRYQKTFRQHEINQKLQAEINSQQVQKSVEDQRITALIRQNDDLRRQLQLGCPSSTTSPLQASANSSPNSSPYQGSGLKTSGDIPVISNVMSLSNTPARIKRTLGLSLQNGENKKAKVGNGFNGNTTNSPSARSSSSYTCSSPTLNKDDADYIESTPMAKLTQPSFYITKVKLEHEESEDKNINHTAAMENNEASLSAFAGHFSMLNQTKKEEDNSDAMTDRNIEEENHLVMEHGQEHTTSHDLGPVGEEPMELSNGVQFPDQLSPNISQVKTEAKLEGIALNVVDAQQQQDNLMVLLEVAAKERDESHAEQHRLILQVEELQSQLQELKQSSVKKEQNHQITQTSLETTDYKMQYLEAEENVKRLQQELDELKIKGLDKQNETKDALAEVDDEVACQVDFLLRELNERDKKQEELMKKVESLEDEKRNLLMCCERLQKDLKAERLQQETQKQP